MKFKIFFSICILFIISSQQAQAHVLKSDGSVGAVIHVSPEDDPIAREPTDFFFEFKDKSGKFKPEDCDCNGIILQNGKQIYSAPLFQNSTNPSLENASFSFTFPEKDVYKVQASGKPTTPGAFEPFTLTWDIRVSRESETQSGADTAKTTSTEQGGLIDWTSRHIPHLIGAFLILIFFIYYVVKQKVFRSKTSAK